MNRMLHYVVYASLLTGIPCNSFAQTLQPRTAIQTQPAAEIARHSDALVDFLGVNAHAAVTDSAWQPVVGALRTLGVRHVRDDADFDGSQAYFDRHQQLSTMGVKALFTAPKGASQASLGTFAGRVSADAEGLEAANGLDVFGDSTWVRQARAAVDAVHAAATAKGLVSVGPTLASPASYALLGDLSAKKTYAGLATLPCVGTEEMTALRCGSVAAMQESASETSQPFVVTGATTLPGELPEAVAAIYLPRVLLEEWNAGAKRSYRADLNPGAASEFALLHKDGSETAAFRAMQALISLLKDPGAAFSPTALPYSLSGVDASVHHALFQKRDGSYYLALWIEAPSYDVKTGKMLAVPGQVAKLETTAAMTVTTYEFDETGQVTAKGSGLSTPQMIPVSDRLTVVKLTPEPATSAAAASTASAVLGATRLLTATAATAATPANAPLGTTTVYYVANSGNDANSGLTAAQPWKTIAKVNASTALYKPGTAILLHRGDVFRDDYLRLTNHVNAAPDTSLTNTPMAIAGTASQPIVIGAYGTGVNPLIDGADPLKVTWQKVTATTWKATVAQLPSKVYVDSTTAETVALVPQANAVGPFKPYTAYKYLDLVTDANGSKYVVYGPSGTIGTPVLGYGQPWQGVTNNLPGNHSQTFSATLTGLQNVEQAPGSWYGTGTTVYVHLRDGSDPNKHTIEGTYRNYGVLLMSVNYVTVENLSIERVLLDGIAMGTYTDSSLPGQYFTNEYNSALNNSVWNWGNIGGGCLPMRNACTGTPEAGIFSMAYATGVSEPVRGTTISGNYVGRSDQYFAIRAQAGVAGIQALGQNGALISNNTIVTVNNQCLNYQAFQTPYNIGGDISYNHCGNNQGNFFFGQTVGGRLHHNVAANSYGEGVQIGGNDNGGTVDHNLLYNLGITAGMTAFNGIDCNGGASYMTLANNTIVNVYAASITLELGCDHAYVVNNVLDMRSPNTGYFYYWVFASSPSATFSNNLYSSSIYGHPFTVHYTLPEWKVFTGETNAVQANPIYVNAAQGDYRLAANSPGKARSLSLTGVTAGSLDQGANLSLP